MYNLEKRVENLNKLFKQLKKRRKTMSKAGYCCDSREMLDEIILNIEDELYEEEYNLEENK